MDFAAQFTAFADLLKDVDQSGPAPAPGAVSRPTATPASIGPKDLLNVTVPAPKARKDPKEIWDEDEIPDPVDDDVDDGRIVPSYEFSYRQSVETTDTFLGMSGKDPSSSCCEDMLLTIQLPEVASAADIDLDVKPTYLKLNHPLYKLSVYLPRKVYEEKGQAKWDASKKALKVTLRINREDDLVPSMV